MSYQCYKQKMEWRSRLWSICVLLLLCVSFFALGAAAGGRTRTEKTPPASPLSFRQQTAEPIKTYKI